MINEVALIGKLDHAGQSYERPSVYRLARLDSGEVGVLSATVVTNPETIVGIVVDGYVECIREPVKRTFDMPADRIVDHLEAIADNVRT